MLLVGAIEACAAYQGVRAVLAFRRARSREDLEGANLRALSAIACAALGAGEGLRYVGVVLLGVLAVAYVAYVAHKRTAPQLFES
jgi:hypothetical protein